jgi:hypothetical protein
LLTSIFKSKPGSGYPAEGILFPHHRQYSTLTDTSGFCPKKFVKDFFVPKKQKHEMRLTNGLAKNRRTEVLSAFVSLFCFGFGRRIKI